MAKSDRYTFSYVVIVAIPMLIYIFGHDLDRIFGLYIFLVPVILIPTFVVGLIWFAALLRNAAYRRWRRVVSIAAAPPIALALFIGLGAMGVNPESIRFAFGKRDYLAEIAELPKSDEPRIKLFDWGSTGGVGVGTISHTLIYDESDEIGLPSEQRSAAWRSRIIQFCPGNLMCSILGFNPDRPAVQIKKMGDHFFLATEFYQ